MDYDTVGRGELILGEARVALQPLLGKADGQRRALALFGVSDLVLEGIASLVFDGRNPQAVRIEHDLIGTLGSQHVQCRGPADGLGIEIHRQVEIDEGIGLVARGVLDLHGRHDVHLVVARRGPIGSYGGAVVERAQRWELLFGGTDVPAGRELTPAEWERLRGGERKLLGVLVSVVFGRSMITACNGLTPTPVQSITSSTSSSFGNIDRPDGPRKCSGAPGFEEAVHALVALGYSNADAASAVRKVIDDQGALAPIDLIKAALAAIKK